MSKNPVTIYRLKLGLGMPEFPDAEMSTFCRGEDELIEEIKKLLPLKVGPNFQIKIEAEEVFDARPL